jgi:phosphatidylserine decarboxylase
MCWVQPGDMLRTGERFGLIRFGSRLDVYLPEGVAPQVTLGQTMVAGETVIAFIGQDVPARAARIE